MTSSTLRLCSGADVAEAVPYLLGFVPAASVVLLSLRAWRLGLAVRADLPAEQDEPEFAAAAARRLARGGATQAIVVVYPGTGTVPGRDAHHVVVGLLQQELGGCGIGVLLALCVGSDRWWSCGCPPGPSGAAGGDPAGGGCSAGPSCVAGGCGGAAGEPLRAGPGQPVSAVAAAATYAGLVALPDRQALADTVGPPTPTAAAAMRREIRRTALHGLRSVAPGEQRQPGEPADPGVPAASLFPAEETLELLAATLELFAAGQPVLSDAEVARLVLGLRDTAVRDTALCWLEDEQGEAALALWQELSRRSVAPFDAAPLTLLAWTAWSRGNGALAGMAVERARRSDPGYRLAELLDRAVAHGLHPAHALRLTRRMHAPGEGAPAAGVRRSP